MTMPHLILQSLTDLDAEGVSPHTLRGYGQDLRAWAKWYDQTAGGQAREAPLSLEARKALRAWLEQREKHLYADNPHLFLGQRGLLSGPGIYRIVTKHGRPADIEGLTPHALRHSFAKNLIDAGRRLTVAAALMGHESLDALAITSRPSWEDLARAVNR